MNTEVMETAEVKEENAMEVKEEMKTMETVENAETVESVEIDIEAKKAEIVKKIDVLNIRLDEIRLVNADGERLNATNWGKDTTNTGNDTVGGLLRKRMREYASEIVALKRDLNSLYFTLAPELQALQSCGNDFAKSLADACVDNMRNIAIISVDDYYDKAIYASYKREPKYGIDGKIVEALQVMASVGVERVGIAPELLGVAIPLLASVGYTFESITQPVTIEAQEIKGLGKINAITYYSFKKA